MPLAVHTLSIFGVRIKIEAARQLTLYAAQLKDAARPCLKEASMAKLFASTLAGRVCSDAIHIHGGYGYVSDFPVERIYRDVRVCQIYEALRTPAVARHRACRDEWLTF